MPTGRALEPAAGGPRRKARRRNRRSIGRKWKSDLVIDQVDPSPLGSPRPSDPQAPGRSAPRRARPRPRHGRSGHGAGGVRPRARRAAPWRVPSGSSPATDSPISATASDAIPNAMQASSPSLVMRAMWSTFLVAGTRAPHCPTAPSRRALPIKGSDEASSIPWMPTAGPERRVKWGAHAPARRATASEPERMAMPVTTKPEAVAPAATLDASSDGPAPNRRKS